MLVFPDSGFADTNRGEEALLENALKSKYACLSQRARVVLMWYARSFGSLVVTEEELLRSASKEGGAPVMPRAEIALAIAELADEGIIQMLEYRYERYLLLSLRQLPVIHSLEEKTCLSPIPQSELLRAVIRPARQRLEDVLLQVISLLAMPDATQLTKDGRLRRPVLQRLEGITPFSTQLLLDCGWQELKQEEGRYSLSAGFLLELLFSLGMLSKQKNRFELSVPVLDHWMRQSEMERYRGLQHYLCRITSMINPFFAYCFHHLILAQPHSWYRLSDLSVVWRQARKRDMGIFGSEQQLEAWLELLYAAGIVEVGQIEEADGQMTLLFSKCQSSLEEQVTSRQQLAVLPGGDILLLPNCEPSVRFELELVANRQIDQGVSWYQMTEASLGRAFAHSRSVASITAFLLDYSGEGMLPQEVTQLMLDASGSWERKGGAIVASAARYPQLTGHKLDACKANSLLPFRQLTYISSQLPVVPGSFKAEAVVCEGLRQDLLNKWSQAPLLWTQQLRSYHDSTCQELLELALGWGLAVRFKKNNDEVICLIPYRMTQQEVSQLQISGYLYVANSYLLSDESSEQIVGSDSWQQLQLIIPQ